MRVLWKTVCKSSNDDCVREQLHLRRVFNLDLAHSESSLRIQVHSTWI